MSRSLPAAAILLLLSLAGCLPVSVNPLSTAENASADSRLPGVWYGKSGEDRVFLHFVAGEGPQMQVVEVDHEKSGKAHTTSYNVFVTAIEDSRYMNVRDAKSDNAPYYFARYRISSSGMLTIWLMSDKSAAKAIRAGKIEGNVVKKRDDEIDVKITDTTKRLAAFVRKSDADLLFDQKFGTFRKLTLPSIEPAAIPAQAPRKKVPAGTPSKKEKKSS